MKDCLRRLILPFDRPIFNYLYWTIQIIVVWTLLNHAVFILGDDMYYIDNICQGHPMDFHIMRTSGRFTPFMHVDLNWMLLLPECCRDSFAFFSYLENAVLLVLTVGLFVFCIRRMIPEGRHLGLAAFLAVPLLFVVPEFYYAYSWDIYPEVRLMFFGAILLASLLRLLERGCVFSGVVMIVSAALMTMYKETAFIFSFVIAATLLLFGWKSLSVRVRSFLFGLLGVAVVYLLCYYFFIHRYKCVTYHADHMISLKDAFLFYFSTPVMIGALILGVVRGVRILFCGSRRHLLADALLFAGLIFSFSYVVLGLTYSYFVTPANFFFIIVFVYWLTSASRGRFGRALVLTACTGFIATTVWAFPKAWETVLQIQGRRVDEPRAVRTIVANPEFKEVLYYLPEETFDSSYWRDNFRRYLVFFGGEDLKFSAISTLPKTVKPGQVLVVSKFDSVSDAFVQAFYKMTPSIADLVWYYVIYGGGVKDLPAR